MKTLLLEDSIDNSQTQNQDIRQKKSPEKKNFPQQRQQ